MKSKHILFSIVSILILMLLNGCYTSMGTVRHHRVYDDEVVYVEEEEVESTVNVYHHYYSRPYVSTRFVYYDPYDYWYDDPGLYISIGYYHRPYYYYSNYYGCVYPGWYPVVYSPYYVPAWYYYPKHHNPFYAYKRRDFKKRRDMTGRQFTRRNNRDGYRDGGYNSGNGIGRNNSDDNYGRRIISRRSGAGVIRNETPTIARKKDIITKRKTDRLPERSIKTRPIEEKRNYRVERTRNVRDAQPKRNYRREVSTNKKSREKVTRKIERRSNYTYKSVQKRNAGTKTRKSSSVRKVSNLDKEKSQSAKSSGYSRPKVRESNRSSVTNQAKRSSSSRSSYSPKKSSSKSSSNSNRKRGRR